jgi:type III secretory pathway component EscV
MSDIRHDSAARGVAANGGPPRSSGTPPSTGPHLGPIPITATGVLIVIALVASVVYLAVAIFVRDPSQIPLLASATVVLGLVFAAIAAVGARATWRSSVEGHDVRAFAHAVVGGLAALVSAGCFAGAIILFLLR